MQGLSLRRFLAAVGFFCLACALLSWQRRLASGKSDLHLMLTILFASSFCLSALIGTNQNRIVCWALIVAVLALLAPVLVASILGSL